MQGKWVPCTDCGLPTALPCPIPLSKSVTENTYIEQPLPLLVERQSVKVASARRLYDINIHTSSMFKINFVAGALITTGTLFI